MKIQNLVIALPKEKDVVEFEDDKWSYTPYPKELSVIKSVFDWEEYPLDFKEKWYDYIDKEFTRREEGFWFINKGVPTYITGTNYMYLQWSPRLMSGNRTFGNQTDYSTYSGKLVNQTVTILWNVLS